MGRNTDTDLWPSERDKSRIWSKRNVRYYLYPEFSRTKHIRFFFKFYLFLRERERERQSTSRGGAERETQNPKQVPGSELSAQNPTRGSNP